MVKCGVLFEVRTEFLIFFNVGFGLNGLKRSLKSLLIWCGSTLFNFQTIYLCSKFYLCFVCASNLVCYCKGGTSVEGAENNVCTEEAYIVLKYFKN
jgi:hypothetical protein